MAYRFLPGVEPGLRSVTFFFGFLVLYCVWLWLVPLTGLITNDTPGWKQVAAFLLPLPFAAGFDLWLRLSWKPEIVTIYPPPPGLFNRLIEREYGVFWFPGLICVPIWLWVAGLLVVLIL